MIADKELMSKNIKRFMEEKNVNATEVCQALGFKHNTFSDWINAKAYPRIDKIEKMAKYFGVTKADLVEDKSVIIDRATALANVIMQHNEDQDLLKKLHSLPKENQDFIIQQIELFYNNYSNR